MTDKVDWSGVMPKTLALAEQRIVTWHVVVPHAMPFEEVLKPDFWTHVAGRMRPHQRIIVDCDSGAWTATLFVRAAQRLSARVVVLEKHEFEETAPLQSAADFSVKWGGPAHKFRVLRNSDESVIKHGFETQEDANVFLAGYIKEVA